MGTRADILRLGCFLAGLLLLAGSIPLSYLRITGLVEDSDRVAQTQQVLGAVEGLRGDLSAVEAARRALVITGDASFKERVNAALAALRLDVVGLKSLTADHAEQQRTLVDLAALAERRVAQVEAFTAEGPVDAAAQAERIHRGLALSGEITALLDRMRDVESRLLQERTRKSKEGARFTVVTAVASGGLGVAVVVASFVLFVRETRARRRGEAHLAVAARKIAGASAQLQAFFSSSLDLAGMAGFDGHFKEVNASWQRLLGWTREEILAQPWLHFVHPDDHDATVREAEKLQQGAKTLNFENRYRCKDGSYRWISWSVPAPAPGTDVLYCIGRDVTELKAQEEKLRALNAKLGEVNRELEAFSYSVSHDLRAPLRHANGFVELLEKHAGAALDDKSKRYLRVIAEATSRMGRLIDDLLSFSRMGRAEMKPARVSMDQLVGEVRSELATEGRVIDWDVRPLPDATGDPSMLRQVWANLLANAVKYTKHRESARIEVGFAAMNGKGEAYYVRDNGAGFDMAYVGKLFGVFQRLHSAQEFEGTGVGLANVKRIIDRHGGRLWAEGKVGEGAVFYFTVPLAGEERR